MTNISYLVKCLECSADRAAELDSLLAENIRLVAEELKKHAGAQ